MKKHLLFSLFAFSILVFSCTRKVYVIKKPLPPGQAKKVAGTQSAKPFAPGQQKKKKTVVVVTN